MVSNVTLKEKNVVFILKTIIFIFISAILLLKGEPYFLLVMLYALLSSYDERIYIISNCSYSSIFHDNQLWFPILICNYGRIILNRQSI